METFALRPTLTFGPGALEILDTLTDRRVLVVTDHFLATSGLLNRITERLGGCTVEVFDQVEPDPSLSLVARGVKILRAFRPDVVIAFGGGSPMDCAKAMCYFSPPQKAAPSVGTPSNLICSGGMNPPCAEVSHSLDARTALTAPAHPPLWCIPTTAGTGSEVTSFAVLTDTERGVKYPVVDDALLPVRAILDPGFLAGVPPAVTADTGMDVLTHALEAYVARGANPFTDALAEKAVALAYASLPKAHAGDAGAKAEMLYASCLAGLAFNAAGLGVCHAMAHALGGRFHVPHGRLNALLLPHVIAFNAAQPGPAAKYGRLARLCGLAGSPRALSAALTRLRASLGIPAALAVPAPELRDALPHLVSAALADVCLPGNPRAAAAEDLETMMRELTG